MIEKQVILAKTEYDAMEAELTDLRTIVNRRTVLTIVEEVSNWSRVRYAASGTRIKYILGTESDEDKMKVLSEHIGDLYNKLAKMEEDLGIRQDEINRLKKLTWYQKIFSRKNI